MTDLKLGVCTERCETCRWVEDFLKAHNVTFEKVTMTEDREHLPALTLGTTTIHWGDGGGNTLFAFVLARIACESELVSERQVE